jgi:hypothetical protein
MTWIGSPAGAAVLPATVVVASADFAVVEPAGAAVFELPHAANVSAITATAATVDRPKRLLDLVVELVLK